jgi:hypothetical protein
MFFFTYWVSTVLRCMGLLFKNGDSKPASKTRPRRATMMFDGYLLVHFETTHDNSICLSSNRRGFWMSSLQVSWSPKGKFIVFLGGYQNSPI